MWGRNRIRNRLAALEEYIAGQKNGLDLEPDRAASPTSNKRAIGRRELLRTLSMAAGGAAAGGVAAIASTSPARANDNDPILAGRKTLSSSPTIAAIQTDYPTTGFALTDDPSYNPMIAPIGFTAPLVEIHGTREAHTGLGVSGKDYGIVAGGGRAPLLLTAVHYDPTKDTQHHNSGEFIVQYLIVPGVILWFCVQSGTPGEWVQLAGPHQTADFYPMAAPLRVYDSRTTGGPIALGQSRVIDTIAGGVRAVVVNLTVTRTKNRGYLQLYANNGAVPTGSSINWFTDGQDTANMAVTAVDETGQVKVTAGGYGSTDFVIDLLGNFV